MGFRNLGKLIAFANPLDQSAVSQILKANAGKGKFAQGLSIFRHGAQQIASGGYFRGRNLRSVGGELRSLRGGNVGGEMATMSKQGNAMRRRARDINREVGRNRKMLAGGVAAYAGLNMMAPDSGLTGAANTMVGGAAAFAGLRYGVAPRFGTRAAIGLGAAGGAYAGARMMGII